MCFSATASFSAALVLGSIGALSLREVWLRRSYRAIPFAMIPMLFGIQQAAEGVIWLLLTPGGHAWIPAATSIFIMFAYILWPIWTAFSVALLEQQLVRRNFLYCVMSFGFVWSSLCGYYATQYGVVATQLQKHICYSSPHFDAHSWVWGITYLFVLAAPFFISSIPGFAWWGTLLIASCVFTVVFWAVAFTSVWCFFSALLSVILLHIIRSQKL
jgi:hypothetical protein